MGTIAEQPLQSPRAGWYPDPISAAHVRWWNGEGWTARQADHMATAAIAVIEPLLTEPEPDLTHRVAGHSLIIKLEELWDAGAIHADPATGRVVLNDEATSWYRAVLGERRMAQELTLLGEDWTVLHSVPIGSGQTDIDHVVIGPGGIFTITTKNRPGKSVSVDAGALSVDDQPEPYIIQANAEARAAASRLQKAIAEELIGPLHVTPVIAFIDPASITIKEAPSLVRILAAHEVHLVLAERITLSDEEVARIVDVARRPSTWHDSPSPTPPGEHLEREFAALEAELGPLAAEPVRRRVAVEERKRRRGIPRPVVVMVALAVGIAAVLYLSQVLPGYVAGLLP